MAADPNPQLTAALNEQLAIVEPQIAGLDALSQITNLSSASIANIALEKGARTRRRDLIFAVFKERDEMMAAEDALAKDGYPALPMVSVSPILLAELREELAVIEAAFAIFGTPPGAGLSLDFSTVIHTPQFVPPK